MNKTIDLIEKLKPVLKEIKLIESFERVRQHYDEPKFWYYSAIISDKHLKHDGRHFHSKASGVSFFSQENAVLKALAEAIERYNNFAFFKSTVDYVGKYSEIERRAIDPKKFIYFSNKQLGKKAYKKFIIHNDSTFRWTEVKSISNKLTRLVPCQAIYLSYPRAKKEPIIYPSISTGAAGHFSLDSAILSGVYEILERDAFMIFYLNRLKPRRFDLASSENKEIKSLCEISQRYNLEIFSLDIMTDLEIPSIASVIIDRSGLSKAVSVGLKSNLNVEKAIIGSIHEAFHTRTWIREAYIQKPTKITQKELVKDSSIMNRGLFWYPPESIQELSFFIQNLDNTKIKPINRNISDEDQLSKLKNVLAEKGHEIYYKDITSKYFKDIPFRVVKVIIPGMQPVYLNEKYPLFGGSRLKSVPIALGRKSSKSLNSYPHPFL